MAITVELLDALLSPTPAAAGTCSPRQQAETYLQTMCVQDRARGLLTLLLQFAAQPGANAGREMVACVLLRRDIANLVGAREIVLLKEMVEPTLSLFVETGFKSCRRQVGHCLAEICASLSLLSERDSDEAVVSILSRISVACGEAEVESLRLLASLSDRAPLALWRSAQNVPQMVSKAIGVLRNANSLPGMEAIFEAIVYLGLAGQVATSGASEESTFLLGARGRPECLKLDPSSPVTQFGRNCLPPLLEMMTHALDESTSDSVSKIMQHLSQAASSCPSLLAGDVETFAAVVRSCMFLASKHSESAARLASLEVLASICDVEDVKRNRLSASTPEEVQMRNMILSGKGLAPDAKGVIQICTEFLVNGVDDDVEGWATDPATLEDDVGTWDDDDDAIYAESLMGLFLHNVGGGASSLPVVLPLVEALLADAHWKHQRAALSTLQCCLLATPVTFSQHVPVAMETALKLASSDSVRVQFQAMHLLGAICEADSSSGAPLRQQYGSRIMEAASALVQSPCTKVAAVSCLTIVSYCRGGGRSNSDNLEGENFVVPFLEPVLTALLAGPLSWDVDSQSNGVVAVKVRAIGAIACLAEAGREAFIPFYPRVMSGLIACAQIQVSSGNSHDLAALRGAAIEAATILGQSIGEANREAFVGDAEQIMNIALPLLNDDSTMMIPVDQLLAACARIASVMGDSYAPFVGSVLPHLIRRAMEPPDVSITDGNDADLEASRRGEYEIDQDEGTESMTVALPGKGVKKVTINTTKIQEKSLAARALYEHANALGASFGPYVATTMQAFLPLINFQYSSEVRSTAAQAMAAVFESACLLEEQTLQDGFESMEAPKKYVPTLAKALSSQIVMEDPSETEVVFAMGDSLSEILYSAYSRLKTVEGDLTAGFSIDDASSTVKHLMQSLTGCLNRRSKIIRIIQGCDGALTGEDELHEYSELLQFEQELLTPLVDSVGYTLKLFKERFAPVFDSVVAPALGPLLGPSGNSDGRARHAALCLYDDCVEHCGRVAASQHAPSLIKGVLLGLADEDSEVKTVSIYGIAQIARHAPGDVLLPYGETILQNLLAICSTSKDGIDDIVSLEYAVSALGSLTLYGTAPLGNVKIKDSILKTFLNHLPIREDEDEAKVCHSGFCEIVEKRCLNTTSETATVLRVVGDTLVCIAEGEDIATPETCSQFAEILFNMQRDVPAGQMEQAFALVSPNGQDAIRDVLAEHALPRASANVVTP